jgi:tRNA (mo5U34)-methyltransferase
MTTRRDLAAEIIRSNPEWYHSIELAPGIITPGRSPIEVWRKELDDLCLPDLSEKSVLDIGAYDGFFSFAAEQRGAARVTALDHYVWSTDMVEYMKDWRETRETGSLLPPPHESCHWHPQELPGRRPFEAARSLLGSRIEPVVGDFMTMDLGSLGQYDVVLFLGVLYHMEDPLRAMRRVASVTAPGGLAVVETAAIEIPELAGSAFCEFYPGQEFNNDPTNWWVPNAKALEGLCLAAGFREVRVLTEPPGQPGQPGQPRQSFPMRLSSAIRHLLFETHVPQRPGYEEETGLQKMRYRAIAHARL